MRRPEPAAGLLALVLGLLHWWLAPDSGTDLAAQLARASFASTAPLTPVDFSWYGGIHPFSYSLLSPWVMAALGVHLTGVLAAVAGSVLWARLVRAQSRPLASALIGALFLTADVASGRTTFALGAAAGLGALCVLPHRGRAAALAVLTALLSPVAAAFLGLVAAVLVLHRRPAGWPLGLGAAVPVMLLATLFPAGGVQPYSASSVPSAVLAALAVAALASVAEVRTGALLYAAAVVLLLLHDDPVGSNVLRLGLLLAAPVLLATARHRPRVVLAVAALVMAWQAGPPAGDLAAPAPLPTAALQAELADVGAHRVEVVAPRDHRESSDLVGQVLLARGWARQQDRVLNPLFYDDQGLTPGRYLDWLHRRGVDHVAVPRHGSLDFGGRREARLLRDGPVPGLAPVWQDRDWSLYAVVDNQPLAQGLLSATRTAIRLQGAPGPLDVHVRWSRWLTVEGPACLERHGDEVRLRVDGAGPVTLTSSLRPRGHCD